MTTLHRTFMIVLAQMATPWMSLAQPPCLHHNSIDWLVIDSEVVVKAKVVSFKSIKNHPKLSELQIKVLETIKGEVEGILRIPIETRRERTWAERLVKSRNDVLLFLCAKPRGYQEPEVGKVIADYDLPLYYFARIELRNPQNAITLNFRTLRNAKDVMDKVRAVARANLIQPKPAPYTFRLINLDSITVPLNDKMEAVAQDWAVSPDLTKKRYGEIVLWGFKKLRNKPFESGYWYATLRSPGGDLRFGLRIDSDKTNKLFAWVINGQEAIKVEDVTLDQNNLKIEFPYYDSAITASIDHDARRMSGTWRKSAGKNKFSELPFSASMTRTHADRGSELDRSFFGRWKVSFSSSQDPAVAIFDSTSAESFQRKDVRTYQGTILTTTGDYRYLAGDIVNGKLELSVFDGAHAFLFRAELVDENNLKGDFWSRDSWHETWTATRDQHARLPDAFEQTRWNGDAKLEDMRFPTLDGKLMSLADKTFAGKVRLISIFGSWCPNCHDSAIYLSSLHKKYASQGLSIVGLAFELSGAFERDAKQVRRYVERHGTQYPILLAGLADKKKASQTLPILDRVRSYPTTIFLNARNEVISIHTGFTGPATGKAYEDLKSQFEAIIKKQLSL